MAYMTISLTRLSGPLKDRITCQIVLGTRTQQ